MVRIIKHGVLTLINTLHISISLFQAYDYRYIHYFTITVFINTFIYLFYFCSYLVYTQLFIYYQIKY